jgi:single-strand DNA-binding protein
MNFNKVILMGRLTADPELKDGKNAKYVDFSIAVNRAYKENKEVHYFNCRSYGPIAETINKHFSKGRAILVEGRLDNSRWQDENGKNRSMIRIIAEEFEFVDSPKKDSSQEAVASMSGLSGTTGSGSADYDNL